LRCNVENSDKIKENFSFFYEFFDEILIKLS